MSGECTVTGMTVVDVAWLQEAQGCCLHAGFFLFLPGNFLPISLSLIRPPARGRVARSFTKEMC